jgi:D-glycero-alpha-D-manno-heptose-7-phosphate kinase
MVLQEEKYQVQEAEYLFFYCPKTSKLKVAEALLKFGGKIQPFQFTSEGLITWTID